MRFQLSDWIRRVLNVRHSPSRHDWKKPLMSQRGRGRRLAYEYLETRELLAADLVVLDIWTQPATVTQGQGYVIYATVKNQGNTTADAGWFANQEALFYVDGVQYGEGDDYDGLAAGASITVYSNTLTGPSAGAHTLKVKADGNNEVSESNESNNERSESITVAPPPRPDLIAYSVSVSDTTVNPGQSITVNWTAKNQGQANASSTQQGVMWSTNSTISLSDTLLEKEYLGSMGVNVTSPESHTITIPSSATPGTTYYIGVYADYDQTVSESDETNNGSSAVAVTVNQADLVVTDILMNGQTSLPSVRSGDSVSLDFDVLNQGTAPTIADVHMRWYWGTSSGSTANYIDQGSLGSIDGLSPGESERETDASWVIPSLAAGTYWLTGVIDWDGRVPESNESNNTRSESFVVTRPDLIAYGVSVSDTTVNPGQSITVNWTAKNQGQAIAGATQQGVMWSTDSTIARTDILLEKEYLGTMGVNVTSPEAHTITIPTNATPGTTYYIGVYADYDLTESESDEGNNASSAITVTINQADLIVTDILMNGQTTLPSVKSGDSVSLDFDVLNQGSAPTIADVHMRWYWGMSSGSTANYIDEGSLGSIDGLSAGESERETDASWVIPNLAAGTYWLTGVIDWDGRVPESNEGNNARSESFTVIKPDLVAYGVSATDTTVNPGQSITVNWVAKNLGQAGAVATQQGVMWSTDSTIALSDTLLEKEYLGPMGVDVTSPEAHTITIPASATPGATYYIGVYADYDLTEGESDESNNASSAIAVTINQADLVVTDVLMNGQTTLPGVRSSDSVSLDFDVLNQGTAPTIADVHMRWYWGTSSGSTANYIDQGSLGTLNGLAPGESERETDASWVIPNLAVGTYWLTGVIDWDGRVPEYNEGNNARSEPFEILLPDLDVLSVTGTQASYSVGDTLWAETVVKNVGDATASNTRLDWYLGTASNSKYRLIEHDAWLGGVYPLNDMSPNEQDTDEINWGGWSIPLDVPEGTYYVYAFAENDTGDSNPSNDWDRSNSFTIHANVTFDVGGTVRYEDRQFSTSGWLGNVWKSVRYATVELLDQANNVLASAVTSATGAYLFDNITMLSGTQLKLRTRAESDAGQVYTQWPGGIAGNMYEAISSAISVTTPQTYLLNFDISIAQNAAAWNILDMLVVGYQFAQSWMTDSSERSGLTGVDAIWEPGDATDTQYNMISNNIFVGSGGSYDDDFNDIPILHEYGHFVTDVASTFDGWSWSRTHTWDGTSDPEMAWNEGFADFFCVAAAAEYASIVSAVGVPAGNYVDVEYNINQGSEFGSVNRSKAVEGAVAGVLWDLYDTVADSSDTYNSSDGRTKLFTLFDENLDGRLDAPDIGDLRTAWINRYGDAPLIDPIFAHHVPDIFEGIPSVINLQTFGTPISGYGGLEVSFQLANDRSSTALNTDFVVLLSQDNRPDASDTALWTLDFLWDWQIEPGGVLTVSNELALPAGLSVGANRYLIAATSGAFSTTYTAYAAEQITISDQLDLVAAIPPKPGDILFKSGQLAGWQEAFILGKDVIEQDDGSLVSTQFGPWKPGHVGVYDHYDTATQEHVVIESVAGGVQDTRYANIDDFGQSDIYMGARTVLGLTDADRADIVQAARNALGKSYAYTAFEWLVFGAGLGYGPLSKGTTQYTCVGLSEIAYETVGKNIVGSDQETAWPVALSPLKQYNRTMPVGEFSVSSGALVEFPIYGVYRNQEITTGLNVSYPVGLGIQFINGALRWQVPTDAQGDYPIDVALAYAGLNASQRIIIHVMGGTTNHAPTDISLSGTSVVENQSSGTVVGLVSGTDPDAGQSATLTFSLVSGYGDNSLFSIDPATKQLKTAAVFDYEARSSYDIKVRATDTGSPALTYDEPFTINIVDVNEQPTDISLTNASVAENQAVGTVVGVLSGTDPDAGQSATLTFSLISGYGDNSLFSIDPATKQLKTADVFDYETRSSYNIKVRATDAGSPALTYDEPFTISIINVNEQPTDISLTNDSVAENQAVGTVVGVLSGTDPDASQSATLIFSLVSGYGDNSLFSIDPATKQLKTAAVFDYEIRSSYNIKVRATDAGSPALTYDEPFTIAVGNLNDAPTATDDTYAVNENTVLRVPAPGVFTNDNDVDGDPLSAQLVTGPSHGAMAFNKATGLFSYKPSANYFGTDTFTYQVYDGAAWSNVATVTININPINDAPIANNDAYTMDQNPAGNASLSIAAPGLVGNDTDIDSGSLSAVWVSDPGHGSLSLSADGSFTYQSTGGYVGTDSFTYKANDGQSNSNVATVTITVNPPAGVPPTVEGVIINGGSAQRSMVTSIIVMFNTVVTIDDLATAFQVVNKAGGSPVGLIASRSDAGDKTSVALTFTGSGIVGGSLTDGNYLLKVYADKVHASGYNLDGNGDGTPSDNFTYGASAADKFFRFFGDQDGDRDVDATDRFRFVRSRGRIRGQAGYLWYFDSDNDGDVDLVGTDVTQFNLRYRKRLAF